MKATVFAVPRMYADHHVLKVRRILDQIQGVSEIYASSAFHSLEVTFNPKKTSEQAIREALDAAGYLGDLPTVEESLLPESSAQTGRDGLFRHSTAYGQTRLDISFAQELPPVDRSLWPWRETAPAKEPAAEE
ncbi:MAG: heavy-metal-associated domain-containing protein [Chloroflexi bacterium]|nr:heavy-metal-associated domain-containing protein [Chloroflexota bacterium]